MGIHVSSYIIIGIFLPNKLLISYQHLWKGDKFGFNEDALQKDVSMLVVYWMKIKICIIRIILIIEDDNGMKPVIHEESPVSIGKACSNGKIVWIRLKNSILRIYEYTTKMLVMPLLSC